MGGELFIEIHHKMGREVQHRKQNTRYLLWLWVIFSFIALQALQSDPLLNQHLHVSHWFGCSKAKMVPLNLKPDICADSIDLYSFRIVQAACTCRSFYVVETQKCFLQ